jgi:hypothetical protein
MTTLDLHPEELFDKAAQGTLSEDERARLDAHLAQCAACRFERQVTQDFASLPLPALDVDHFVTHALTAGASASVRPHRATRRATFLVAAAISLMGMGSLAAVAQWTGVWPRVVEALSEAPRPPPRTPQSAPEETVRLVDPSPAEAPPEPEVDVAPPPEARPAPAPIARAVELPRPLPQHVVFAPPPPPPPPTAAELFAAGNRARLDGERALAIATYRQLLTSFPDSVEGVQTRATLGRLLLDQGNPSGAIEQLDAYLAGPDGTLREEVLSARAQAFMRLGREGDEARAWQALLEEYPGSLHGERARARLGVLGAGP